MFYNDLRGGQPDDGRSSELNGENGELHSSGHPDKVTSPGVFRVGKAGRCPDYGRDRKTAQGTLQAMKGYGTVFDKSDNQAAYKPS
jgi:hypothetical protein